jgi:hypothetical protein
MIDSVFHGPPTSLKGAAGTATVGLDIVGAQLYAKDFSVNGTPGWVALTGGVVVATTFPGTDIGMQINNAVAALNGAYGTIFVPPGKYTYITDIYLSTPCRLLMDTAAIMNYTGTGKAVKCGPDGLMSYNSAQSSPYIIQGGQFTGGANMAYGLFFNTYVVNTHVLNMQMLNFGNASAWNIWYQSQNWYNVIDKLWLWTTPGALSQNGIRLNGAADNGQSRLFVTESLLQPMTQAGIGIYINGYNTIVRGSTISGGWTGACVQLGGWSSTSVLYDCTIEMSNTGAIVLIGDSSGIYTGNFLDGVQILTTQADLHNTVNPAVAFAAVATASAVIRNWRVEGLRIADMAANTTLFTLNNIAGQHGNYASANLAQNNNGAFNLSSLAGFIHNTGSNISNWIGDDEIEVANGGLVIPNTSSPTSAGTAGITGQIAWDSGNLYVCVVGGAAGAATWKKIALSSD